MKCRINIFQSAIYFFQSNWEIGVEPGVGMAQGLLDNYPENNFVTVDTVDTIDGKRLMQLFNLKILKKQFMLVH